MTKETGKTKSSATDEELRPWFLYSVHPPLSVTHKAIAKEFHSSKNGALTAEDFTFGSQESVWWQCAQDPDHPAWRARIGDRTVKESGCPYCAGKMAYKENNLKKLYPEIAKEWHPKRNRNAWPSEVLPQSNKKVWWQCSKVKTHEWECVISSRTSRGSGCPFCSGNKVCKTNSLSTIYPFIAAQWSSLNEDLSPDDVTCGSRKVIWWECPHGPDHIWQSEVKTRTMAGATSSSNGCPFCHGLRASVTNRLSALFPDIAAEWHQSENRKSGLELEDMVAKSPKKVWWLCSQNRTHKWQARIQDRTSKGSGCPYCTGKMASRTNNLQTAYPEVAAEWHRKRNGELAPSAVLPKSNKKFWWQCKGNRQHEWQAAVSTRTANGSGCPLCARKR